MSTAAVELRDGMPEWLPPLAVKELRQGLRSAVFTWGYLFLLAGAGCLGAFNLLSGIGASGAEAEVLRGFLVNQFLWLSLGCVVLVPSIVYLRATGSEHADVTERLVLAGQTPGSQALGRFWAAGLLLVMLVGVFLPILSLALVLGSFDPLSVLYLLAAVPVIGWVASGAALAWTVLFQRGLAVAFGLGLLALGLALLWGLAYALCTMLIEGPAILYSAEFVASNVFFLIVGAYAACFGIGLASSAGWHRR